MTQFKRVHIEITNICNLQCSFCPEVERDKGVMGLADFETLCAQAVPLTERICLHLMGEPLTHPDFDKILAIGSRLGAKFNIVSNGLLLKKWAREIASESSVAQVNLSLQIHGDNFPTRDPSAYLRSVLAATSYLEEVRPDIYINYRLWNLGAEALHNEEIFQALEDKYQMALPRSVDVRAANKGVRITGRTYLHFDSRFDWPSFENPHQGEIGYCYALKNHVGILTDGTVVPCCLDKEGVMPLGNALTQTLNEVLSTPRALGIRQGFDRGCRTEKFCQHCDFISRFDRKAQGLAMTNKLKKVSDVEVSL